MNAKEPASQQTPVVLKELGVTQLLQAILRRGDKRPQRLLQLASGRSPLLDVPVEYPRAQGGRTSQGLEQRPSPVR